MSAARRAAEIDQKVAVHLRNLRATDLQAAAAGGVDQLPGFAAGGFLNVEPPVRLLIGCVASRNSVILSISAAMTAGSPRSPWYSASREDVVGGHAAVPVGVAHVGVAQHVDAARPVDRARFDQRVLGLAAIGAAVHAQRAADTAGNAAHERQAGDAGLLRRARDFDVGHRRAGADARVLDGDIAKTAAEPDHHARHAAVAHDEIGAKPDDGHRNLRRQIRQAHSQVRSSSGMNKTCAGPPTRNQVSSASG